MAPSRGKGKARATPARDAPAGPSRRTPRATRRTKSDTPDVYQDMLAEAAVTGPDAPVDRPPKRRRVATSVTLPSPQKQPNGKARQTEHEDSGTPLATHQQTVEESTDADSDERDFAFEDVDLTTPTTGPLHSTAIQAVSISLTHPSTTPSRPAHTKRKGPASLADKAHRLLLHKAHLLCLLGHAIYANSWCNDETVHRNLEPVLGERTKVLLRARMRGRESQFDRDAMFMDGLAQSVEVWRGRFRVTAEGMMRRGALGAEGDVEAGGEVAGVGEVVDRAAFVRGSKRLMGTQDLGNQLFCALLRSVGVEARMVSSLQVTPLSSTPVKSTPQKPVKRTVYASHAAAHADHSASEHSDTSIRSSRSLGGIPSARQRLGQPSFATSPSATTVPPPPAEQSRRHVRKLAYPVFWTEALNPAYQKWTPADPVVTGTHNKPAKLEPPASYAPNQLTYALAFSPDGSARDVTRRYTRAYNAKTRRARVESTAGGAGWWDKILRFFHRTRGGEGWRDREQIED
ncbi:hypothetical protein LTR53_017759, partial [Teratosphaeriaceae sp. CCFEE 6253]